MNSMQVVPHLYGFKWFKLKEKNLSTNNITKNVDITLKCYTDLLYEMQQR